MRTQFPRILSGLALLVVGAAMPSMAEEKIQAVVSSSGRIVFTNLVDNAPTPPPPVIAESTDVLADEMPQVLRSMVEVISQNYGVDPALVRAVMKTESNFNRWAVSNKGARGLMQLIPATGARYGVRDFFDPQQNVEGGVQYLKFLLEKFNGNLDLSLAAYNAGENLVERLGRVPPIPETANYVRRVRANYAKKTLPAAPVVMPPAPKPVVAATPEKPPDQQPVRQAKQEPSVFRTVDERGVVHFSNIGPP
jgi:soluble lytic murein transglycosylase-like protein